MPTLNFSMEIPVRYIGYMNDCEDQGFAIVPYVLKYPLYAKAYRELYLEKGRRVILDNGAYEEGTSRDVINIIDAVDRLGGPQDDLLVVLPDIPCSNESTTHSLKAKKMLLLTEPKLESNLIGVVQGSTLLNQWASYTQLYDSGIRNFALSFLWDRITFLREYALCMDDRAPVHLLGCYGVQEVQWLRHQPWDLRLSIDTVKPLKAAIAEKSIEAYERGEINIKWDPTLALGDKVLERYRRNAEILRTLCHIDPRSVSHDPNYTRPLKRSSDSRAI